MQYHPIVRGEDAADRTNGRARRISAMHACHGDRALAGLAVIDRDYAAAIDAPGHFILVLAGRHAGIAVDATVSITEEFHTGHALSSGSSDLTESGLRLLHTRRRVETIGGERVDALSQHDWIGPGGVFTTPVHALEPTGKMKRHPSNAFANAFGHQGFDSRLGIVLRASNPDPCAVLNPAIMRVGRVDLHVHVLLQLRQPFVRTGLFTAAFIFNQPSRT